MMPLMKVTNSARYAAKALGRIGDRSISSVLVAAQER
jgi:hypothetical protein